MSKKLKILKILDKSIAILFLIVIFLGCFNMVSPKYIMLLLVWEEFLILISYYIEVFFLRILLKILLKKFSLKELNNNKI